MTLVKVVDNGEQKLCSILSKVAKFWQLLKILKILKVYMTILSYIHVCFLGYFHMDLVE